MTTTRPMRSLTRRAIPTQARSTVTVEKILGAATAILVDRGLQGFNTNAVADAASINVATLYHYFPDKVAILAELFIRDQSRRTEFITEKMNEFPMVVDLDRWVADLVHSIVDVRRAVPATAILRQVCRTVPEIVELEESDNDAMITHFSRVLRLRFPSLAPGRSRHCARALIETGAILLDRVSVDEEASQGLIRETITMLSSYLERLGVRPT